MHASRSHTAPTRVVRPASHAGSWYASDPDDLEEQLSAWLTAVDGRQCPSSTSVADSTPPATRSPLALPVHDARAIIAPHAGYSYSGPAAAYAYACIPAQTGRVKRVFILGPSHHHYLPGCALSRCETYKTPLGDWELDRQLIDELCSGQQFEWMQASTDEDEHSIEMQLPYLRKVFSHSSAPLPLLVPILVGALSTSAEHRYGELLAPYLADPANFFVISSDFCHWGTRFSYTYYRAHDAEMASNLSSRSAPPAPTEPIHQSIRQLDNEGMQTISFDTSTSALQQDKTARRARDDFAAYLKKTKNTICGRHPIGVLLSAVAVLEERHAQTAECRFLRYEVGNDEALSEASRWTASKGKELPDNPTSPFASSLDPCSASI